MKNLLAFADESGNNSFDFDTQGTHFIVASVIVKMEDKQKIEEQLEVIRKKYFQTGEIKSSKIGKDNIRRKKILSAVLNLDFWIYAVIVDKKKLEGEGFKYKKSFYKYLNGLVYQELFKVYPNLNLSVDEHGENSFMLEFKKYVGSNHQPDLFTGSDFNMYKSEDSILIQLADLIAGTLGRCYDESKKDSESVTFLELLKPKLSNIRYFPREKSNLFHEPMEGAGEFDKIIAETAFNQVQLFLEDANKKSLDQIEKDQINFLKLLLLYFNTFGRDSFITTREILKHLHIGREDKITEESFRTNVIAKLRDKGLLIASSSKRGKNGGYKIPTSADDLLTYIDHGNGIIIPMIARIKRCRDIVKLATENNLDLLEGTTYKELKAIIDR